MISYSNGYLLISQPWADSESFQRKFTPGQKLGITFKLRHYKHTSSVTVKGSELYELNDGSVMPALKLCCPLRMKRIQRRVYVRADVPANHPVKVTFWQGNMSTEPTDCPTFSGLVSNISAGGIQVLTNLDASILPVKNDPIGLKLFFVHDDRPIAINAIIRHIDETTSAKATIGMQFIGLDQTRQGLIDLQAIYGKVGEFGKSQTRPRRRAAGA